GAGTMSRGLGVRQLQFLAALAALEAEQGERAFKVSDVVCSLWNKTTVKAEYREWQRRRSDAENARDRERKAYEAATKAERTARAEAGDDDAKEWLARDRHMELLRLAIRRRPKWRVQSRPRTEPIGEWGNSLEGMLNPSRVIAELQRRGLAKSRLG